MARLMPNVKWPCQWKRKLLASVVESQHLYASPTWSAKVASVDRTRTDLICPQRTAALRVIRAYRTVPGEAALLLAEMPPADLIGLKRIRIRDRLSVAANPGEPRTSKTSIKREERQATIELWQARWDLQRLEPGRVESCQA